MKDDLISRKAALEVIRGILNTSVGFTCVLEEMIAMVETVPSVPAVPLDKLCEWMNVHCGRPNDCNDRLCGECNLDGEGFEYETCWKTLLTKWMEEQDAAD